MTEAIAAVEAVEAAPAVVLTRAEKYAKTIETLKKRIEADTKKLAEVEVEAATAEKLASVTVNTALVVRIGRAETSKEVAARVLGIKEEESGSLRYKVVFGEGIDTDVVLIQASQIISIIDETPAAAAA